MSRYTDFTSALAALVDAADLLVQDRRPTYHLTVHPPGFGSGVTVRFDIGFGTHNDIGYRWDSQDGYGMRGSVRVDLLASPAVTAGDAPRALTAGADEDEEFWDEAATVKDAVVSVARDVLTPAVIRDHIHALATDALEFESAQIRSAVAKAQDCARRIQSTLVQEQVRLAAAAQEQTVIRAIAGQEFRGDPDTLAVAASAALAAGAAP